MNIIVIGLGSMGKRRIRLIKKNYPMYQIIGVDTSQDRRKETELEFQINTFSNIESALEGFMAQVAFVCTSPLSHYNIMLDCLNNDLNIFCEINLISHGHSDLKRMATERNRIIFISSTFLYRREIQYIKRQIEELKGNAIYTYHVGQYLPDWHPWESYKKYFVGDKRTNGCRELFAIELSWLIDAFGDIESIHSYKSKVTKLEIDYPDAYIVVIEHKDGHIGTLTVDLASRKARRTFELISEATHVLWDGTPEGLESFNAKGNGFEKIMLYDVIEKNLNYAENILENMYIDEIEEFFRCIRDGSQARHNLDRDILLLSYIDLIER